jgi:hypothetical protein
VPQIPTLDVQNPPDVHVERSIVRFRAMVQDTSSSPEMYLAKQPDGKCGGWGLANTTKGYIEGGINVADLRECSVLWAVNIPGETSWCADEIDNVISCMSMDSKCYFSRTKYPR